jgi:hypothetical protein
MFNTLFLAFCGGFCGGLASSLATDVYQKIKASPRLQKLGKVCKDTALAPAVVMEKAIGEFADGIQAGRVQH